MLAGYLCNLTTDCVQPVSLCDLIRGRLSQADEVTCMAWAPLQQALAIGTSGGDVLCFDTVLHSLQVGVWRPQNCSPATYPYQQERAQ